MGLAMWHTTELYQDVQYMSNRLSDDFYTALNNENDEACEAPKDGQDACDGKLMWRQTSSGPSCSFTADSGFTK